MAEDNKNIDGIKPLSKDQIAAQRKAVLEAIGEGERPAVPVKAETKPKEASRSVADDIKPIKVVPPKEAKPTIGKGVDLLHPAEGNIIRASHSGWREELTKLIGHADAGTRTTAPSKAPAEAKPVEVPKADNGPREARRPDPVEKPKPAEIPVSLPKPAAVEVIKPEPTAVKPEIVVAPVPKPEIKAPLLTRPKPDTGSVPVKEGKKGDDLDKVVLRPLSELHKPAVSEVNPFGNRITQMRIEQTKKATVNDPAPARKHKKPATLGRATAGRLAARVTAILALSLAILAFGYALFAVVVIKLSVDAPFTRAIARYLPVPAAFTQDGILDYYVYRDLSDRLSAGVTDTAAVRSAVIRQLIIDGLMLRYGLEDTGSVQAVDAVNGRIVHDEMINQVGINRVNKIADMIMRGEDFVKVASKYSDEQGQATVEIAAIDSYSYAAAVRDLKPGDTSAVVYGADGYYIYHCFERTESQIQLGFLFIRAKLLSAYLDEAVPNYSFWSLVE